MKIYKISIIFLILMIFSVGFVFAEDVNQTDSDLEVTDGDVISVDDQSYNDLQNKFPKEMPAEVNLTTDYSFDVTKDKYYYVDIIGSAGKSYTINGNNKVINGKGDAGALRIYNATLTIKNLTIQNCARSSIIVENSTLILNNVKFMDNKDNSSGAAIYSYFAAVTADNCTFSENYATRGAAINVERSVLSISETKFTNKNSMVWSLIYAETNSEVYINYCRFENLKSKYATVVFASNSHIRAYQSTFVNLTATATGGAIASKNLNKNVIIQNCEFENVKSAKNGGAIFIDVNADSDSYLRGTSVINLTKFINCSSEFGGAILQLGGFLNVLGSYFSNNHAVYDGGAIYSSNATFYAVNSVFNNNYGEKVSDSLSRGGALYLDDSNDIEIASSNFTDNKASEGGAIFLFDTSFVIYDSSSINNGEFLHSYFNSQTSNFKNCYLGPQDKRDNYTFDDAYYPSVVSFEGKQIILNRLPITGNVTDSFFDLRNFNAVTPVKDQGSNGACWAFGTTGALESAFKIATGITLDISEDNIQNSGLRYSFYGKPSLTEGGKLLSGLGYVLSWLGIVNTEYDGYDELGKISQILFTPDSYHFTDVMLINTKNSTAVKQALLDYGALTIHINGADPQNKYYNKTSHALYCNNESLGNHFVTLVGWNDTYSRSNFIIDPGMDGAWIVKNSWGTGWGDEGYFYLSYADAPFLDADAVCYIINNTVVYNKLYQYDIPAFDGFLIYDDVNSLSYTNTYESIGNDLISAIGTYFKNNKTSYTINVKVNGNVVYSQKGTSAYYGFQTIKLNNPVAVNNGDKFSIEIEVDTNTVPFLSDSRLFFQKDHSVVNTPKGYEELANRGRTASIKVYTINNVNNVSGVKVVSNPKSNITIKSTVEGATITISQNGKNMASTTVKDGKAVFNTTLSSGNYTIITSYGDEDIMSLLEIYPSIVVSDYEINRTVNGALDLLIIFFDDDDYLNNTSIAGTLDGKNIVVGVTDVNGTLYINNLNLDVGTHKLTVSNPVTGEEDSITINIFSRFGSAGNIEMDYFDGSAFKVIVYDDYGNPVSKGQKVTINIKNKNYIAYTDAKGYVSFVIPEDITPGSYILKVTYQGQTISKTLKVKQVLKSKKTVKVKKSAKKLVLKATLKTSKNKAIKGKKITFKINGKKLTAKTNKKGLAKVTVKKSVLKKLKAGKKYAVKISYLKDTIKSTLKVKK